VGLEKTTRFYQASTSELYGLVQEVPQRETTPFYPRSPYACAKLYGYWIVTNYREGYNMFAVNGILFNHESPRRGGTFVTKKVTTTVAKIMAGKAQKIVLGNLDAKRDWGHARDYVEAMWMMLQQDRPVDYVIATSKQYTVRQLVTLAFEFMGKTVTWRGEGLAEEGIDETGRVVCCVSEHYFRPTEVETLLGDATKAKEDLGWVAKTSFKDLILDMMRYDCENQGIEIPGNPEEIVKRQDEYS